MTTHPAALNEPREADTVTLSETSKRYAEALGALEAENASLRRELVAASRINVLGTQAGERLGRAYLRLFAALLDVRDRLRAGDADGALGAIAEIEASDLRAARRDGGAGA